MSEWAEDGSHRGGHRGRGRGGGRGGRSGYRGGRGGYQQDNSFNGESLYGQEQSQGQQYCLEPSDEGQSFSAGRGGDRGGRGARGSRGGRGGDRGGRGGGGNRNQYGDPSDPSDYTRPTDPSTPQRGQNQSNASGAAGSAPLRNSGGPSSPSATSFTSPLLARALNKGIDTLEDFEFFTAKKIVSALIAETNMSYVCSRLEPTGAPEEKEKRKLFLSTIFTVGHDVEFVETIVVPFLKWLSKEGVSTGGLVTARDKIAQEVAQASGLLQALRNHLYDIPEEALETVAWFVHLLLKSARPKYREHDVMLKLAPDLCGDRLYGKDIAQMLKADFDPTVHGSKEPEVSLEMRKAMTPGGRHSNDWPDFHDISIVPTIDDVKCKNPFLPTAKDNWPLLDRLFRLMRMDMIASLQDQIDRRAQKQRRFAYPARLAGIQLTDKGDWSFRLEFSLQANHPAARGTKQMITDYWATGPGTKAFTMDTLVLISPADKLHEPLFIGSVAVRQLDTFQLLDHVEQLKFMAALGSSAPKKLKATEIGICTPSIGIRMPQDILQEALEYMTRPHPQLAIVYANIALFMYKPILSRLQAMPLVPFYSEVDKRSQKPEDRPANPLPHPLLEDLKFEHVRIRAGMSRVNGMEGELDEGQKQGAMMAMQQQITLIQGPPGTGKTYVGCFIVARLLASRPSTKILCMAYTNHSVDDFCESLHKCGITSMVRIGKRSQHPVASLYSLDTLMRQWQADQLFNSRYKLHVSALESAAASARTTQEAVDALNGRGLDKMWREVKEHLASIGPSTKRKWQGVAAGGRKVREDELWRRWVRGEGPGSWEPVEDRSKYPRSCWNLPLAERIERANGWVAAMMDEAREKLVIALAACEEARAGLESLQAQKAMSVVEKCQVILCTTTGAAKYEEILKAANCDVVLVEEAGEILEPHVLSAIYDAKALVMIGDHLQLRPKVETYELRVESQKGCNLNISLFERLILDNFPHATLTTQHRMHPDISHLIKPTYQKKGKLLLDSAKVSQHPPVKGLPPGVRVVFFDHEKAENNANSMPEEGGTSYSNEFEAEMAAKMVSYFQKQGYKNDHIVVLTPYLGQLRLIAGKLASAKISGRDKADIRQLLSKDPPKSLQASTSPDKQVRVASIDNYQGEESDIVIISLVRSNPHQRMGFIGDLNRINVLFSRARHGMVVLGNAQFLKTVRNPEHRQMWIEQIDLFEKKGQVYQGFPAYCTRHNLPAAILTPEDFDRLVPNGGCDKICGQPLAKCPLSHPCQKKCHTPEDHLVSECTMEFGWSCNATPSHETKYKCHQGPPRSCRTCDDIAETKKRASAEAEADRKRLEDATAEINQKLIADRQRLEELQRVHNLEEERLRAEDELTRLAIEKERQEEETRILREVSAAKRDEKIREVRDTANRKKAELAAKERAKEMQNRQIEKDFKASSAQVATITQLAEAATNRNWELFEQRLEELDSPMRPILAQKLSRYVGGAAADWFLASETTAKSANRFHPNIDEKVVAAWKQSLANFAEAKRMEAMRKFGPKAKDPQSPDSFAILGNLLCNFFIGEIPDINKLKLIIKQVTEIGNTPNASSETAIFALYVQAHLVGGLAGKLSAIKTDEEAKFAGLAASAEAASLAASFLRLPPTKVNQILPQAYWRDSAVTIFSKHSPAIATVLLGTPGPKDKDDVLSEDEMLRREWIATKENHKFSSDAMDELMGMAALLNMKRRMLETIDRVFFCKARATSIKDVGYNLRFEGNPGTGKTTVAALYGKILADLGVIKGGAQVQRELQQQKDNDARKQADKQRKAAADQQAAMSAALRNAFGSRNVAPEVTIPAAAAAPTVDSKDKDNDEDQPKPFVETTGAALVDGGVTELKKMLAQIEKAGGGVLFVDEAYMLEPNSPGLGSGKQVLNYLLQEMEKKRGSLVVVFAGYKKKMEELFQYNEGLPSRFAATIAFEDYDDAQLFAIFTGLMRKHGGKKALEFDGGTDQWGRVLIRRLGQGRNAPGFGNGRAVRNLFDIVVNRQSKRWAKDKSVNMFALTKEDLLGPSAAAAAKNSVAWERLKSMIGLKKIKASVEQLYELVKVNELLELEMRPRQNIALNRLFLGNPGTGKTTVAKIYGEILRDFGLLSKGDLVLKAASDFVGQYLGESGKNTTAIIKQAEGCVLVIDEAYGLHGKDPYKTQVIDTIVEQVQAVPGEDKCVVMLGYKAEMETMMRESNPGLQRRFQLENAFEFDDYSDDELGEILVHKMKQRDLVADSDAIMAAVEKLAIQRDTKPPFGNGGAVENLLSEAVQRKAGRGAGSDRRLVSLDFAPPNEDAANDTNEAVLFKGLIGCDEIIEKLREYKLTFIRAREKGQDPLKKLSLNFRFVGAPGTGKTTVASRMGRMFRGLGVLPSADVVVCSGTDLIGQFVGHSAPKMRDMMDKALGKVLFIDEAYSLASQAGGFGQETIDELVRCMTVDKYMGKMVIIVAGYEKDIDRLMQANEGLRSRFEQIVMFRNFNVADCVQLFNIRISDGEVGLKLSRAGAEALPAQMARLVSHKKFSNGRDVVNWVKRIDRHMATKANDLPIEPEDLQTTMTKMLETLNPPAGVANETPAASAATATPTPRYAPPQTANAPEPPRMREATRQNTAPPDEAEGHNHPHAEQKKEDYFGMNIQKELVPLNDAAVHLNAQQIEELENVADLSTSALAQEVLARLTRLVGSSNTAKDILKKWQGARKSAKKEEAAVKAQAQLERKRIRLLIRCAACGSPTCSFAPYVYGVEVVPE